ncbi:MAG: hypothetical protein LBU35_02490, partial [Holosporales bacterium]|nr:hypothetical protein [Holosporales bacterium]
HGFCITKSQVQIDKPIKTIGTYTVGIALHPEVIVNISLRVMTAQEQEVSDNALPQSTGIQE